jgi:hypothetical protein
LGDVRGGVGHSYIVVESSQERAHAPSLCEPHKCSSCKKTFYRSMEATRHDSFIEEFSILIISMLLIDYTHTHTRILLCVFFVIYPII